MTLRVISPDDLARANGPRATKTLLGSPLAVRWMAAEYLGGLKRPSPPSSVGEMLGLFVLPAKSPLTENAHLARGFGLPLVWREGEGDCGLLPAGLGRVAGTVREVLNQMRLPDDAPGKLGLGLSAVLKDYDLTQLQFDAPSLGVPLLAAAVLTAQRAAPRSLVFATGELRREPGWQKGLCEVMPVSGIMPKAHAVAELVAGRECFFFVPAANLAEAREASASLPNIQVKAIQADRGTVATLLDDLLFRLDVPPGLSQPLAVRTAYANRDYVRRRFDERRDYYLANLVEALSRQVREKCSGAVDPAPQRLALALSRSYEVAVLAILTLRPAEVLLLHTAETKETCKNVVAWFAEREPQGFQAPEIASSLIRLRREDARLDDCARWLAASEAVSGVEITGGTTAMSAILVRAAQQVGSRIFYFDHDFNGGPMVGTESLRVLEWLARSDS